MIFCHQLISEKLFSPYAHIQYTHGYTFEDVQCTWQRCCEEVWIGKRHKRMERCDRMERCIWHCTLSYSKYALDDDVHSMLCSTTSATKCSKFWKVYYAHLSRPQNTNQDLCGFDFGLVQVDLGLNMRLLGLLELKVLSWDLTHDFFIMTGELNCDTRLRTSLSLIWSYLDLAILVVLIQDLLLLNGDLPVLTWYLNLDFIKQLKTYLWHAIINFAHTS